MGEKNVILIVDDVDVSRELLKQIWQDDKEYEVLEASGSQEAIKILEQTDEINVVLLDVFMPGMDGMALLAYMKSRRQYAKIPVVINTQSGEDALEEKALRMGADDFILKPYVPGVIKKRVENIIERNLYARARKDELTGVYNCETFYYQTKRLLFHNMDVRFVMLYFNIARFKMVNELFGIKEGDKVLIRIANAIREAAASRGTYARITADHFVCCIPKTEMGQDSYFCSHIEDKVGELEQEYHFRMECGIYEIIDVNLPIAVMCDRAKFAISEMKSSYAERYIYYNEEIGKRYQEELELIRDMEEALDSGQFYIELQPVYNAGTGKPVSAEALVRWQHPEKGRISPEMFISLFEKNGFVMKLDMFVWEEACKLLSELQEKGGVVNPISVNVSRIDLYDPNLADRLEGLLHKYGLKKSMLKLEITESAYTENPKEILTIVSDLRKRGFELLMDDFGSGYSSLNMLKELPVDILKIDMKFMDDFEFSQRAGNIIISIVRMAKLLHMKTVAEGVETWGQVEFLKKVGCDKIQGYYFSRPLSVERYKQLMEEEADYLATADGEGIKKGILVVDDVRVVRTSLMRALGDDYHYYEAGEGKEALEILQCCARDINLIITDIFMPEMDGFELMQAVQSNPVYSYIPVIVVTASEEREKEIKALKLGAIDVITKPYDPVTVSHRVKNVLKLSEVEWFQMEIRLLNDGAGCDKI